MFTVMVDIMIMGILLRVYLQSFSKLSSFLGNLNGLGLGGNNNNNKYAMSFLA